MLVRARQSACRCRYRYSKEGRRWAATFYLMALATTTYVPAVFYSSIIGGSRAACLTDHVVWCPILRMIPRLPPKQCCSPTLYAEQWWWTTTRMP